MSERPDTASALIGSITTLTYSRPMKADNPMPKSESARPEAT